MLRDLLVQVRFLIWGTCVHVVLSTSSAFQAAVTLRDFLVCNWIPSLWDPFHGLCFAICQDTVISLFLLSSFQFTQAVWTIEGKTATLCPCFHLVCSYSPLDVFG